MELPLPGPGGYYQRSTIFHSGGEDDEKVSSLVGGKGEHREGVSSLSCCRLSLCFSPQLPGLSAEL